ncbi:DMT family transporter [Saccharothrix obliqua]|uniref:DMT family transporter n=1 Tax=Saccharothrix obliqua TaxID=2861747 RepID=UPI001C6071ED|nr:multidrug efflux SMR transporter [Saccharothrix obliqua]MBW4718559.1 multidrug efflux SMR transporter [Saccharothrix obliqua]
MAYLFLFGAILSELIGAIATRLSDGFSKLVPSVVAVVGVVGAYVLLSFALKRGMGIGTAYATWAAVGVAMVALIGVFAFEEHLTPVQFGGLALVIGGVVALELGAADAH